MTNREWLIKAITPIANEEGIGPARNVYWESFLNSWTAVANGLALMALKKPCQTVTISQMESTDGDKYGGSAIENPSCKDVIEFYSFNHFDLRYMSLYSQMVEFFDWWLDQDVDMEEPLLWGSSKKLAEAWNEFAEKKRGSEQ